MGNKKMKKITLIVLALCSFALNAAVTRTSSPGTAISNTTNACTNGNNDALGGIVDSITFTEIGTIVDANVSVDIDHTWRGDIQMDLTYNGTTINLAIDHGGNPDNLYAFYDDAAALPCSDATLCGNTTDDTSCFDAATRSTCQPDAALSGFNSIASNLGSFDLRICDDAGGDDGFLTSWSITLQGQPGDGLPVELLNLEVE